MLQNLPGFELTHFDHEGVERPVYRRGKGPGVVVIHEIPGLTDAVAEFGRRVADAGFTVAMPVLFGVPGAPFSVGRSVYEIGRACVNREFLVLAAKASSPITHWLRALCRDLHAELGGPGVGALGMCLTGNFALTLMLEPSVMAPVLSQPSLPFPLTPDLRSALHLSDDDLAKVKERVTEDNVCILGLRFSNDWMSPPERFETLRDEFGEGFEGIEIDSSPGNPHQIPWYAHSVLTNDLVDEEGHPTRQALDRVLAFLHEHLES